MIITTSHNRSLETVYHGPTNTLGSKIYVYDLDGQKRRLICKVSYAYEDRNPHEAALMAALEVMRKKGYGPGWFEGQYIGGSTARGYHWVHID